MKTTNDSSYRVNKVATRMMVGTRVRANRGPWVGADTWGREGLPARAATRSVQAILTVLGSAAILSALSVLVLPASAFAESPAEMASPTIQYGTHYEQVGPIRLFVSGHLGSLRKGDDYIPIPLAVEVKGNGPRLELRPSSFELINADGEVIQAASFSDIRKNYRKERFDHRLLKRQPFLSRNEFRFAVGVPSNFYPAADGGVRYESVDLGPRTWTADVIYFPRPASGLSETLTLRLKGDGLVVPVEVTFLVPST